MEYQRSQRNLKFDDDLEIINKQVKQLEIKPVQNMLSKFFKKK